MKKHTKSRFIVSMIAGWCTLLLLGACQPTAGQAPAEGFALTDRDYSEQYKDTDGELLVDYHCVLPVVSEGPAAAAQKINAELRAMVDEDQAAITDEEIGYWAEARDYRAARRELDEHDVWTGYWVDRSYDLELNDEKRFSLKITYIEYTGGVYPATLISGLNVDALTGEPLTLAAVFGGEDWQSRLIDEVLTQIQKRGTENLLEGYEQKIKNYDYEQDGSWYLRDDGLHFVYNNYEIAPYAAGPQEFIIPLV